MDIDIRANLRADVAEEGEIALPAHVLAQVVRALPGELLELEVDGKELAIRSGSYATKLQLSEPGQALQLEFPEAYLGSIEGRLLAQATSHVRYAAAVAEYQAVYRGVKLELGDNKTRAVATDGYRLAYYHIDEGTALNEDIIIPARSLEEMAKILSEDSVELAIQNHQLSIKSGIYNMNIKLMEGDFPNYERVIPQNFVTSVSLDGKALLESVNRVAVMTDKTANNRIDFFVKDGTLQISAEGGYGRSQEVLEVSQEGSESQISLAYNAKFLEDALKPIDGEVKLSFSGSTSPSVLHSSRDSSYLAMVVPLKTG